MANEDEFLDLSDDDLDILNAKQCREKVIGLLDDKRRKKEFADKTELKLQALQAELNTKREGVEALYRTLETEKAKIQNERRARDKERESKIEAQNARIRAYLGEIMYKRMDPPILLTDQESTEASAGGTGPSSTSNALIKAGQDEHVSTDPPLHTLLISYFKPGTSIRCDLRYRIDQTTTVSQMKSDATKYWKLDESQYSLRTVSGSKCQEDMFIWEVFKDGELSQLFLLPKFTKNTVVSEAEKKAILPKIGTYRRSKKLSESLDQEIGITVDQEIKKCGGSALLVKIADLRTSDHTKRIRFCDIVVFLAILATYFFQHRGPSDAYALVDDLDRTLCFDDFKRINTTEDALVWWQGSYPRLLAADSTLKRYNKLHGYLRLRQQKVKYEDSCDDATMIQRKIAGDDTLVVNCVSPDVPTASNMEKGEMSDLKEYWNLVDSHARIKPGNYGRGLSNPYEYKDDGKLQTLHTIEMDIDGGGYMVDYDLMYDYMQVMTSIEEDIQAFNKFKWIDDRTRVITWSMTLYNIHYDLWTALDFILQIPTTGRAVPTVQVLPFRPNTKETEREALESGTHHVRIILVVYILCVVVTMEIAERHHAYKAGVKYLFTLMGIADLTIVVSTLTNYALQYLVFGRQSTFDIVDVGRREFVHFTAPYGNNYAICFQLDGLFLLFLMVRLSRYFAINRKLYLVWRVLARTFMKYLFSGALTIPVSLFFVFIGQRSFGIRYGFGAFATLNNAWLSCFKLLRGNSDFLLAPHISKSTIGVGKAGHNTGGVVANRDANRNTSPNEDLVYYVSDDFHMWTCIYSILFYSLATICLLNFFKAIFIEEFYLVNLVHHVKQTPRWGMEDWVKWFLPGLFQPFVSKRLVNLKSGYTMFKERY